MIYVKPQIIKISQAPNLKGFLNFVLENKENISPASFYVQYTNIQNKWLKSVDRDFFCNHAQDLVTDLAHSGQRDFAGIVLSSLCKISSGIPERLEVFAKKAYELAKDNGDYVHMMARLNDLRRIYMGNPEKLYDYIQVLYKQEKCLKVLTRDYDKSASAYKSVIRELAPRQDYEKMLAYVRTEIGKLTCKKHPNDAMHKLMLARYTFEKYGNTKSVDYIDMLINKIEQLLNK